MASDIEIQAKEILKLRARLNGLYVEHTGQELEAVEKTMDRDTYMSAEEAIEYGVVDEMLVRRGDEKKGEKEEGGE